MNLKDRIRDVPDFPKPGIVFKDITPLLHDPAALAEAVRQLHALFADRPFDQVAGIESRGFIFGALVAAAAGVGLIPVRKPGKLPGETLREEFELEYGTDAIEIHRDCVAAGGRILVVDDVLATGGTAAATVRLLERAGAEVVGLAFLIELGFLNGRERLGSQMVRSLLLY